METTRHNPKTILHKKLLWPLLWLSLILHSLTGTGGIQRHAPTAFTLAKRSIMDADHTPHAQRVTPEKAPKTSTTMDPVVHAHAVNSSESYLISKKIIFLATALMAIPIMIIGYCACRWHIYKQKRIALACDDIFTVTETGEGMTALFSLNLNLTSDDFLKENGYDEAAQTDNLGTAVFSENHSQNSTLRKLFEQQQETWKQKWQKYKRKGQWKKGETKTTVFCKTVMNLAFGWYEDRKYIYLGYYEDWFRLKAYEKYQAAKLI